MLSVQPLGRSRLQWRFGWLHPPNSYIIGSVRYHVTIWPASTAQQALRELYAWNLSEDQLRERFIAPHDEARPITWAGRTIPGGDISYMHIARSQSEVPAQKARAEFKEYELFKELEDVTNEWVIVAPGSAAPASTSATTQEPADRVVNVCRRFGTVARQLTRRYGKDRATLVVNDEYDAQDLLHALLLIDFLDVREESWNPKYLGGSSRVDLLLPPEKLVIEVKKTRSTLTDRGIGDELAEDVTRYSDPAANRGAATLICFVYDPEHLLANPAGLENDLASASNERLKVVGVVAH